MSADIQQLEAKVRIADYCLQVAKGRRPLRIRMLTKVRPDFVFLQPQMQGVTLNQGQIYATICNQHGAASAVLADGRQLGVKPDEFEVVEWQEPATSN